MRKKATLWRSINLIHCWIMNPLINWLMYWISKVWLVVIISMISVAIFFAISSSWSISRFQWRDMFNFYHYFFYTMAIMTTQGESFGRRSHSKKLSYRLAGAGFCLFAVVMVNLYSSTLTSFITTRKMNLVPTSSIQVVEDGEIDYLMVNQGLGPEMILVFSINLSFI